MPLRSMPLRSTIYPLGMRSIFSYGPMATVRRILLLVVVAAFWMALAEPSRAAYDEEKEIVSTMADVLRAARTVISGKQKLINSKVPVDKGLTGDVVVDLTAAAFRERTGSTWDTIDKSSRLHRYLNAQVQSIREVINERQSTINKPDAGFKGFVPAVFARLINERFSEKMGKEVKIKVTAPPDLVRNRKARPDSFELAGIEILSADDWVHGASYTDLVKSESGDMVRILVPEYYKPACLNCHGDPKGEIDITGYPKEGAKLGDLGGVISFQFFDQ